MDASLQSQLSDDRTSAFPSAHLAQFLAEGLLSSLQAEVISSVAQQRILQAERQHGAVTWNCLEDHRNVLQFLGCTPRLGYEHEKTKNCSEHRNKIP